MITLPPAAHAHAGVKIESVIVHSPLSSIGESSNGSWGRQQQLPTLFLANPWAGLVRSPFDMLVDAEGS